MIRRLLARVRRERAVARAWRDEVERTGWPLGSAHLPSDEQLLDARRSFSMVVDEERDRG